MANHIRVIAATAVGTQSNTVSTSVTNVNTQLTTLIAANLPGTVNPVAQFVAVSSLPDGVTVTSIALMLVQYVG